MSIPTASSRPRLRAAAIVWGLLLAALGVGLVALALDPHLVSTAGLWIADAGPSEAAIAAVGLVLLVGVVITIGSVLSVVHRGQDRVRDRREKEAAVPVDDPAESSAGQDETTEPAAQ